jgi:serine/threonine-protein kinase HipA
MKNSRCLFCEKELGADEIDFHARCLRRMFGSSSTPTIDLSSEEIDRLAKKSIASGLTVPGVQKKLSLSLLKQGRKSFRLTIADLPSGYILKPQSPDFPSLPECEELVMLMADEAGIRTCPHSLVRLNDGSLAYITKRVDRVSEPSGIRKLFMEDFCQLSLFPSESKYQSSYERCGRLIEKYSSAPVFDKTELFFRLVFSFVSLNSDMHLKNFSLLEEKPGVYTLSPAYDLLAVNLVMPSDREETALTLNGKKKGLRRKDFLALATSLAIGDKTAAGLLERVLAHREAFVSLIRDSFLDEASKKRFLSLMHERMERLK